MRRIIIIGLFLLTPLSLIGQNTFKYEIRANGGLRVGTDKVTIDSVIKSGTTIKFYDGSAELRPNTRRDTSVFFVFGMGSGQANDTALFNDNAKAGSWKNLTTDTLVVTNLWGVIETGSGSSTIAVQVSWADTLNAVVPTNLNSSAYTITSTTVGNTDTSFANTKIPPNAIVKGVISGVSAGNRPKYLQFQISGYRIPKY